MVELRGVGYAAGGRTILGGVDVRFERARLTAILGPNGAGKSTLLRIAAGLLRPLAGEVHYDGRPLGTLDARALARRRAVLSQHAEPAFPLAAIEVVEMGRYPHYARVPGARDRDAVKRALAAVGMTERATQRFSTLSAGERQKVQMARVLAQLDAGPGASGRILFLDEPTSNLDVRHQLQLLEIARRLLAEDVTVIAVLHDLNLAGEIADQLVLLDRGRVAWRGERPAGLPIGTIEAVYGVRARAVEDPVDGRRLLRFMS